MLPPLSLSLSLLRANICFSIPSTRVSYLFINRFNSIDLYPYLIKNAKEIFVALMPFFRIPNYFRIPALLWRFEKYNNYNLNFT